MIERYHCVSGDVIYINRENSPKCEHRMGFEPSCNIELNEFRCQSCGEVLSESAMRVAIFKIEL